MSIWDWFQAFYFNMGISTMVNYLVGAVLAIAVGSGIIAMFRRI